MSSWLVPICFEAVAMLIGIWIGTTYQEKPLSKKPDQTTIRISNEVYEKLRALRLGRPKKMTFNRALEELLAASQRIEDGEVRYVVGDQLFRDVAEARGQAIVESVVSQTPAQWPDIYVSIGKADPNAGE